MKHNRVRVLIMILLGLGVQEYAAEFEDFLQPFDAAGLLAETRATVTCCEVIVTNTAWCNPEVIQSKLDALLICPSMPISVPTVITEPGKYCIINNISGAGPLITIAADHVTVDLRGFKLTATSGTAITATGVNGVTVTNGEVEHTSIIDAGAHAFLGVSCQDLTLEGLNIVGGLESIYLDSCTAATISNVYVRGAGMNAAIYCYLCSGVSLNKLMLVQSFFDGVSLDTSSDVTIDDSVIDSLSDGIGPVGRGIVSTESTVVITRCLVANHDQGLLVTGTSGACCVSVSDCFFDRSRSQGCFITGTAGIVDLTRCFFAHSGTHGCEFNTGTPPNGAITECDAMHNGSDGFRTASTVPIEFFNCYASNNGGNGFTLQGTQAVAKRCNAFRNTGVGFTRDGSGTINEYYENVSCQNTGGNYDVGAITAPITSPMNSRGVANVDCANSTLDAVEETISKEVTVDSQLDVIESQVNILLVAHGF